MSRILEARAVISGEDHLSKVLDGISKKFKGIGKDLKVGANLDNMNRQLASAKKQLEAIDRINSAQGKLGSSKYGLAGLKAEADRVAAALAAAKKAGDMGLAKELAAQSKTAQRAVDQATGAINRQTAVLRDARRALSEMGVPISDLAAHERRLRASVDQTTASIARQTAAAKKQHEMMERASAKSQARRDALGGAAATAGVLASHKGKAIGLEAINAAGDMDYAVRYQHVATDVSEAIQRSLLLPQAKRIGQETKFSNRDIVEAQTATMQSLPIRDNDLKAEVGAALVEQVRNYAVIMTAGMKESAEGLRSFLQATNKDISTKERAVAEATRGTNLLVKMGKLGGMSNDDVQAFIKYGFPTGTQAGLSDTTLGALGSVGRRSGLRGDEIGVFARSAASKLVAPTRDGREALTVAGIDYDRYTKMPGGLSAQNLEKFQAGRFGKGLNDSQRSRLVTILENQDLTNREDFIKEVQPVLEESFGKTKKGKTKAQDSAKVAKMIGDFWKLSMESVDAEGLLDAILSNPKMTPALRNAFFTDKHGGKAGILASHMDQFREDRAALQGVVNEPTFSSDKAKYMTQGLGGALDNLKGGWETMVLNIGQANEGLIRFAADGLAKGTDMFSSLSTASQQVLSLLGMGGAAAGGVYGTAKFLGAIFGSGGGATALSASAVALDGSAAALTAAAVKLGGGGVVDAATKTAASTAGGTAAGGLLAGLPSLAILGSGALAGAYLGDAMPKAMGGEDLGGRYLEMRKRIAAVEARMVGSIGYGSSRRTLQMPDGADARLGYSTTYEVSRGLVGDFLRGKQQHRLNLPAFGAGDKQMPGASGPITAEVKSPVPVAVTGTVDGKAEIVVKVEVSPTGELIKAAASAQNASVKLNGIIAANGPGSTGKSSPDAGKGGRD